MLENEPAIRLAAFVGVLAVMLLWEQLHLMVTLLLPMQALRFQLWWVHVLL